MAERMLDSEAKIEARVTELEMALAYQQRLCEQLNQIVCEHSKHMLAMTRTVADLQGRLKELREQRKEPPLDPASEKPPHY